MGGGTAWAPSVDTVSLRPTGWGRAPAQVLVLLSPACSARGTGQARVCEAARAEAADGRRGVGSGLHGEEREPGAHQLLPGAHLQVGQREPGSQPAGILLVNLRACAEGQLLDSREDVRESGAAWAHCDDPSAATSPTWSLECSWHWWRRQKTGVVWLLREEAR